MIESDLEYLRRRAGEEERRAAAASDPRIAAIHQRLAGLYSDRVVAMSDNPGFDPLAQIRAQPQRPISSR